MQRSASTCGWKTPTRLGTSRPSVRSAQAAANRGRWVGLELGPGVVRCRQTALGSRGGPAGPDHLDQRDHR
ncbi:putative uncharacterized protein [Mycobacterium canettii CIPT 140010059]|uniref:Uncharacterized protein n=1 Tax=Mycobacterium canettii (strain CIPT 140010059) TaxID=1048245 RepID=A0AB72XPB5_MYCCP|nr:putative uncharacterized protein [Mycobacterium canettii CIPT 140010059]